jgi:hypothetical protein
MRRRTFISLVGSADAWPLGARARDAGIRYYGRIYMEGKKVDWKNDLKALWYVFKFRFC